MAWGLRKGTMANCLIGPMLHPNQRVSDPSRCTVRLATWTTTSLPLLRMDESDNTCCCWFLVRRRRRGPITIESRLKTNQTNDSILDTLSGLGYHVALKSLPSRLTRSIAAERWVNLSDGPATNQRVQ